MLIRKVQIERTIRLSPAWVSLWEMVQNNPYIILKSLEFTGGEPKIGIEELYDKNGRLIADKSYKF